MILAFHVLVYLHSLPYISLFNALSAHICSRVFPSSFHYLCIYTTNSTLSGSVACRQRGLIAGASQAKGTQAAKVTSVCRFGMGVSLNLACCNYLVNFDVITVAASRPHIEGRFDMYEFFQKFRSSTFR